MFIFFIHYDIKTFPELICKRFSFVFLLIQGAIGVVWFSIWIIVVKESPAKDRYISQDELEYINSSLGNVKKDAPVCTPWKSIFTSTALYAICASHFSENWGFYTLITQLPTFLKGKLNINACNK